MHRTSLTFVNLAGLLAFAWPFLFGTALDARVAPLLWAVALIILLLMTAQTMLGRQRDVRMVTLMATLIALGAAARPLGAGVAGLEPIWTVLLLAGRTLGSRAGFLVGSLTMFVSAIITGGVGPWLPYQMMVGAWVGAAAGAFPSLRGRSEVFLLTTLGLLTGMIAGALLNLWFWPMAVGLTPDIAFAPTAGAVANLTAWLRYGVLTSFGFDIPRAVLTATLVALSAGSILPILRRASRRTRLVAALAS